MLATVRRSGAAWTWALLLQLLLAGPGGCLSRQELFPFGPEHGDLELEAGDDLVSPALELSTALHFFDRSDIDSVYVSATPGGRWGRLGERPRGAEAASGGRPGRAGAARGAGRTGASWAGTRTRWSPGRGVRRSVSKPKGAPASARPADASAPPGHDRSRRVAGFWGARPVCAASRAHCQAPGLLTRDPGTPGPGRSFLSRGSGPGSLSASRHCPLLLGDRTLSAWDQAPDEGQSWVAAGSRAPGLL